MPLTPGTRLGPYVVSAPLGAGGMGEVYRAHDSRLGRDVAIKVLPTHLASMPELRERFDREARAISQLNHPHICTLYDVGHQDGIDFLVMELIDGETLSARLEHGALPLPDVLTLGRQVAQALERAHRAGVVHRDLKPGNIMLTRTGAKLMDFGLARSQGPSPVGGSMTQHATMGAPLTAEGAIVGTFQYMAPEQLEGKDVDARTDLWALGCVLYEMATGTRAFVAESQASLIAAIMDRQPTPMASLQPVTPPTLERIVRRCLAKSRDERFESAGDLAFALESVGDNATSVHSGVRVAPPPRTRNSLTGVAGMIVLAAAAAALGTFAVQRLGAGSGNSAGSAETSRRFDLVLPDSLPMTFVGNTVLAVEQRALALSPQGDNLVYVADDHGTSRLVSMDLVQGTSRPLPGTEGAFGPAFSPDGRWVAFLTATELRKIELSANAPVVLSDIDEPNGVQWLDAERLIVAERQGRYLTRVRASGGRLDSLLLRQTSVTSPVITPDGSRLLSSSMRQARILELKSGTEGVLSMNGQEPVASAAFKDAIHGLSPQLLPSQQLLYVAYGGSGALMGMPVAKGTLKPLGNPVQIAANVRVSPPGIVSQYVAAANTVVYASDPGSGMTHFVRRHADGRVDSLAFPAAEYGAFELSPDGTRIATLLWPPAGKQELWILDIARGTRERMGEATFVATWTADGHAVDYSVVSATGSRMMRMHLDGTGRVDTLARGDSLVRVISADGRWAVRTTPNMYGGFVASGADFMQAGPFMRNLSVLSRFSPDSRWIAATWIEAGRSEVYVSPTDDLQRRVRLSANGGEEPRWRADGRHLVYRYGRDWFEVSFEPGSPPRVGAPVKLFTGPYANVAGYEHSLFPDGSYLLLKDSGVGLARRLSVVTGVEQLVRAGANRGR